MTVLNEHEHIVLCVKWATPEACKVIDNSEYVKSSMTMLSF